MNSPEPSRTRQKVLPSLLSTCLMAALTPAALLVPQAAVQAQQTATGIVSGKVINNENGRFLPRARVSVDGTNISTTTDEYGNYELRGVPAGQAVIKADFTGQPTATRTVQVPASGVVTQAISIGESARQTEDGAYVLDEFEVNSTRMENAREIAINEERLSVNIKNVVSTDAFGNIPNGNVGEFVKFLPGVQIDYGVPTGSQGGYSQTDANAVSVRGFGPEDTAILIDGLPVSSTVPGNLTNQMGLDTLSLNNASRVELIKVATPDMPNNSIGGQINLITKSAFEYSRPTYNFNVFMNINSLDAKLKKTPGPFREDTYKITPGTQFTVTYPVNEKLGFSVTGYWAKNFNHDYRAQPRWNANMNAGYLNGNFTNADGEKSSASNPVLERFIVTETTAMSEKRSGNFKVDWRPTPNQLIRANIQYSSDTSPEMQRRMTFQPNIANGVVWDETKTIGALSNSSATGMTIDSRDKESESITGQVQYTANLWGFIVGASGSVSKSESEYKDAENGHFSGLDVNLNPGRVALYYGADGLPYRVETYTRGTNSAPIDFTQLSNWVSTNATAKSGEAKNQRTISLWKVDVERPLDFIDFLGSNSMSVKVGVRRDEDENEKSGRGTNYREILQPGKSFNVVDVLDEHYRESPGFGLPAQQWASTYKLYDLDQENDLFYVPDFDEPTNTRVENYNSYVGQQKDVKQTRDAWYAMLTGSFLRNRLSFAGGMRQEREKRVGHSPFTDNKWNYLKRKDGSLYTDAAHPNGVRINNTADDLFAQTAAGNALRTALTSEGITFPTAIYGAPNGTSADFRSRQLQYQPYREVNARQKGDPSYSLSSAYKVTSKIDFKAAYSRSFSLPDLENGAANGILSGTSNFQIEEFTPQQQLDFNGATGRIIVANPAIKAEESDNWDFELSYYTESGGKLALSYYTKTVTNQTQNFTIYGESAAFLLEALGLGTDGYEDYLVQTSTNSKSPQDTSGWEFQIQQDFRFLGNFGRRFSGFVTWAMTDFPPPSAVEPFTVTHPNGTTQDIIPSVQRVQMRADRFGGAGLMYSGKRFSAQIRATYRNENQDPTQAVIVRPDGNEIRLMQPAETRVDVNFSYLLNKNYSVYVSARDVFNGRRDREWVDLKGEIPSYAKINDRREFGTIWTVGVNGTF